MILPLTGSTIFLSETLSKKSNLGEKSRVLFKFTLHTLIHWGFGVLESTDNERAESAMEQRTELADKSLITAVKIVSEMRRA